ncbi:Sterol binding ankyrin repeat protein [Taphrina deformans PYCC 5710]|uniref:Sterol binding ankyrin repeat protein n=1 Tax=Taphrina deformans (strain PYCC 5710 / ATCC 11124 / CBS 356.35 / IMI 108563 / JCM 9778 / NBRC 8474) TaxID=1097556 RepID=R4XF63_TAPDE|nr:Sterol binding ankyrin repeat protein [Taphrina deformans PYCC 5710]|eukprot:CCG81997.1 Sterol binding ankyrin repeat protein [Taphrina deformans PYCC 5710]
MNFEERLRQAQLEPVSERSKLIGGKVHKESLDVSTDGMYAIVFDNTFSKQKSKLVTFILQIYPTSGKIPSEQSDTLVDDEDNVPEVFEEHLNGVLMKRRRKKLQGWARRWFVLDFESNTLNYYLNQQSTVLRGAIPLKVAVFSANRHTLEINIDSGAEVWNLRAQSEGSFSMWCQALAASRESKHDGRTHLAPGFKRSPLQRSKGESTHYKDTDLAQSLTDSAQLRTVLTDLKHIREHLRDVIVKASVPATESIDSRPKQHSPSKPRQEPSKAEGQNLSTPRKTFWGKRRTSELASLNYSSDDVSANGRASTTLRGSLDNIESQMGDVLGTFETILSGPSSSMDEKSLVPRVLLESQDIHRSSFDSTRTADEIWVDAESGYGDTGFLLAHHDSDTEPEEIDDASSDDESIAQKLHFDHDAPMSARAQNPAAQFGRKLYPLERVTANIIKRRVIVPKIMDQPPSALKLMTSKVGSDVSSMSAPAASNEPLGLLQRVAEELEYSELLDSAVAANSEDGTRMLIIASFAVSAFSSMRQKERAKRKPFNPMLGETYELVRDDKRYRFVAEKVQHRPLVGVAACAESDKWSFHQYQATAQKFYGKSMLLTTEGFTTVRLMTGDVYTWEKPEVYLKGITWGERFLEPSGEMIIRNLINGEAAIVKFLPAKGWAAGRSEEVTIEAYDAKNKKHNKSVSGTWTNNLTLDKSIIWSTGTLVDEPNSRCGFTTFATQLNEITELEANCLPRTDSRLRPDMRAREQGNLEGAETQKVAIEERQRKRRAELEEAGQTHEPRYFESTADGGTWTMKSGDGNYWVERERGFKSAELIDLFGVTP